MAGAGIEFERTRDLRFVSSICTLPRVWPFIGDDYNPEPSEFEPNPDPRIVYLFCREDHTVGLFTFMPRNAVCWEGHIILLPRRKTPGHVILREAIKWMFENTAALRIIGEIPACNRLALKLVQRAGMTQYGVNPRSLMKNGKLEDLMLFGLSKGEPWAE